jgi:hypothetical protein
MLTRSASCFASWQSARGWFCHPLRAGRRGTVAEDRCFGEVEGTDDGNVLLKLSPRSSYSREIVGPGSGNLAVRIEHGEARAMLHALAEHLGVDVAPEGWHAEFYVCDNGEARMVLHRPGEWIADSNDGSCVEGVTAQAAADAVAALASQDGSEG